MKTPIAFRLPGGKYRPWRQLSTMNQPTAWIFRYSRWSPAVEAPSLRSPVGILNTNRATNTYIHEWAFFDNWSHLAACATYGSAWLPFFLNDPRSVCSSISLLDVLFCFSSFQRHPCTLPHYIVCFLHIVSFCFYPSTSCTPRVRGHSSY